MLGSTPNTSLLIVCSGRMKLFKESSELTAGMDSAGNVLVSEAVNKWKKVGYFRKVRSTTPCSYNQLRYTLFQFMSFI